MTEREETETFHLLVHSPNACNSWDEARLNPEGRNSIQCSHVGGTTQAHRPSNAASQAQQQEAESEHERVST